MYVKTHKIILKYNNKLFNAKDIPSKFNIITVGQKQGSDYVDKRVFTPDSSFLIDRIKLALRRHLAHF